MKLTVSYIQLRGINKLIPLSKQAMKVIKQLETANCKGFRKRGFWKRHYTMTLWNNEEELHAFGRSGAHLDAMKMTKDLASEVGTITIDADQLVSWREGKKLLKNCKVIKY